MKSAFAVLAFVLLSGGAAARAPSELSQSINACLYAATDASKIVKGSLGGDSVVYLQCTGTEAAELYTVLHGNGYEVTNSHTSTNETGYKIVFGSSMCQWLRVDGRGRKMNYTACYLALDIGEAIYDY